MRVRHLWLTDFRNYASADVVFSPEITVVYGRNGEGKSNLLEALSLLTTKRSFRGATAESMVRIGAECAIVRAEAQQADGRELLIEMEIPAGGRTRMQVNKQSISRRKQLSELAALVVFSPDDLVLIKGGPGERRDWLDDLVAQKGAKYGAIVDEFEAIAKQRNALLRNAEGYLKKDAASTLDVFDEQFGVAGEALVAERTAVLDELLSYVAGAYDAIADVPGGIGITYKPSWDGPLLDALADARDGDVRRGTSTVGPHRDDVEFLVCDMSARLFASQGEQRSLVLALRIAAHRWLAEVRQEPPLLLLDDVFSELDESRREALIANLPAAQTVITTAADLPPGVRAADVLEVQAGTVAAK